RSSATSCCIRSRLALNVEPFVSMWDSRICINQPFRNFYFRGEQVRRVGFPLRVQEERERAAAAQALMQQEIHREKIRQQEALDAALAEVVEIPFDERRGQMLDHPRVDGLGPRDHAD